MELKSIRDNGALFADRYTVEFDNGDVYTMSDDADMPNGCCIYVGNLNDELSAYDALSGEKLKHGFSDPLLPSGTRRQITNLLNQFNP